MATNIVEQTAAELPHPPRAASGWLVGPWVDALFIANIAWPIVVLAQRDDGFAGEQGVRFWQLYWITTPHRWITLLIVFLDRGRFQQRPLTFLTLAAAAVILCLSVRLSTGALTCLMAIDYVWNAWHFASQHHGVYRIYDRRAGPLRATYEKWPLRMFLLYVILRVASATWSDPDWESVLHVGDWIAATGAVALFAREILQTRAGGRGRLLYLVSMLGLYVALLWSVHQRWMQWYLPLATASALFHAIEYLTLVTWSVHQRRVDRGDQMGLLGDLVPRWGAALAVFVLIVGAGGWWLDQRYVEVWLFLNVVVGFLHYAYDGLIWRRSG